jgi:DNA polymerase-1
MPLLVAMEHTGVVVRVPALREYSLELEKEIAAHEADLYRLAGGPFNLNSPKQLGELLFDRLKIADKPKRTRTGQYVTTEQELTRFADRHSIIPAMLEYRVVQKLKSTYVDALPDSVVAETGRIHTTFNQLVAATGRLNSENPNLQNIPIRTDKGREIRRAFVAPAPDQVLLAADYSQIELRIMAAITEDPGLVEAFADDVDIHAATSAKVFGVSLSEVSADMRRRAKMINFGLMYGMSAFGLAQRLNIARAEARAIIERYFGQFPKIKQYMGDTVLFARDNGYVQTLRGRRRYLRDIRSRNHAARAAAERVAINAPIQGSAADMIKIAMLDIDRELRERGLATRMILQVHDELVFELPRDELQQVTELVTSAMRDALDLGRVPVIVEVGVGADWLEAH